MKRNSTYNHKQNCLPLIKTTLKQFTIIKSNKNSHPCSKNHSLDALNFTTLKKHKQNIKNTRFKMFPIIEIKKKSFVSLPKVKPIGSTK